MATEIIVTASQEQWLELRKKDVTSTESAALFGMSEHSREAGRARNGKLAIDQFSVL
jgi:hypothetical protein